MTPEDAQAWLDAQPERRKLDHEALQRNIESVTDAGLLPEDAVLEVGPEVRDGNWRLAAMMAQPDEEQP